ncbi:shikimate dehydrogenase [Methylomarinum sp. Ch1-1]|uniref:Shikimate dehydrogenase (NADP(+)) n=1 Tax=Methylomarinum roseum TaxID=3067653 RepID=A0AAU7NYD1_9GAMM|nr:shikimate dehydrogenase [Methylomarinum sp. Ch1-1]MDP4521981.1 shikimate dehydrogenase [Methylomarinum sp. Ch1-1]
MKNIDQYAVFGQPIKHSKSPRIHRLFAEQTGENIEYTAREVPADTFDEAVDQFFAAGGKGLNCTVPLKELAWRRAERLTERARLSKAVNTLAQQEDGSLLGDNTDGIGLVTDLTRNHGITLTDARVLILGAGGASRGIIGPILECKPSRLLIANRTVAKAEQLTEDFADIGKISACGFDHLPGQQFDLILNATSASLSNQLPPLPERLLAENGCCYDLAYANEATAFVRWGQLQNAGHSLDGLGMLVEQAAEAFYLWRGIRPETRPVIALLNAERHPA